MMAQTWILQIELGKSEPKFQKSRRGLTGCIHAHWCVGKAARCCQTFIHHRQIPPPTTTLLSVNPLSYSTLSNFMLSDPMLSDLLRVFWNSLTQMISSKHPSIINNFNCFYVRLPIVFILILIHSLFLQSPSPLLTQLSGGTASGIGCCQKRLSTAMTRIFSTKL